MATANDTYTHIRISYPRHDKVYEATVIKTLQKVRMNTLETDRKMEILSKEMETIKRSK